jgi:hypothetical protein
MKHRRQQNEEDVSIELREKQKGEQREERSQGRRPVTNLDM